MTDNNADQASLEKTLINRLFKERRADRRWKIIRFSIWVLILLLFAALIFSPKQKYTSTITQAPYVSLIRLNGVIMPDRGFSARKILPRLARAFADKKAKGVLIVINSPGGSPVQASIIHDKIIQLKKKYKKKVVVVGLDTLASGAYLVATAADEIYVNRDTLTGSIGVIMSGFGFNDAIEKLGISRRVFTAGADKDRLDPFKPLNPEDAAKVHRVLNEVHQNFINDVLQSRRDRLHGDQNTLFSGDFWTGQTAVKLGLVDGTGNVWDVMKKQFNVTHYKNYSVKPSFLHTLINGIESKLPLALTQNTTHLSAQLD